MQEEWKENPPENLSFSNYVDFIPSYVNATTIMGDYFKPLMAHYGLITPSEFFAKITSPNLSPTDQTNLANQYSSTTNALYKRGIELLKSKKNSTDEVSQTELIIPKSEEELNSVFQRLLETGNRREREDILERLDLCSYFMNEGERHKIGDILLNFKGNLLDVDRSPTTAIASPFFNSENYIRALGITDGIHEKSTALGALKMFRAVSKHHEKPSELNSRIEKLEREISMSLARYSALKGHSTALFTKSQNSFGYANELVRTDFEEDIANSILLAAFEATIE